MTDALETTVQIGQKTYAVGRLSAFDQMHLIADARDILTGLAFLKRDRPKDMSEANYLSTVGMVITAASVRISSETRERIWNMCLSVAKRRETVGYMPVLASPGQMQFADLGPPVINKLIYAVFEHNKLLDFFSESLSDSDGQTTTEKNGQALTEERTG